MPKVIQIVCSYLSVVFCRAVLLFLLVGIFSNAYSQVPAQNAPQVYVNNKPIAPLLLTYGPTVNGNYTWVSTFAGNFYNPGLADGDGATARMQLPHSIAKDAAGNLYVAEYYNRVIRKITTQGVVSTFAGNGGPAATINNIDPLLASFYQPMSIAIDGLGNMYIADDNGNTVRKISNTGVVTTFAGDGVAGFTDGAGNIARFHNPYGVAVDANNNVYVADMNNNAIRKITPLGIVSTLAGGNLGRADGLGSSANFFHPTCLTTDVAGNVYVADEGNSSIRKISPLGLTSTIAGSEAPATVNNIGIPAGLRVDNAGNLFFTSVSKNQIMELTAGGVLNVVAGNVNGGAGYSNGVGNDMFFYRPQDIEFDNAGNLYVVDQGNNIIRKLNISGYSIDKPLPAGLIFDSVTGIIAGTPTVSSPPIDYTITAITATSAKSAVLSIAVNATPSITYDPSSYNLTQNINITPIVPLNNTGIPAVFAINQPLPAGLILNTATGVISGTPTVLSAPVNYTITATNALIVSTTVLTIRVTNIVPLTATITYPEPTNTIVGSNNILVVIATSNNSETPIIYTSNNPAVAVIGSDGLVHVIATGSVSITASQPATANYSAAVPVTQSYTIKQGQIISFPPFAVKNVCDAPFQVNATSSNSTIPITYTSSDTRIATISSTGVITILNKGTTNITVSQVGNTLFNDAAPVTQPLIINAVVIPLISIIPNIDICTGRPVTFTATISNLSSLINPSYQWKLNGANVGTNNPNYTALSITSTDVLTCTAVNNNLSCTATTATFSSSIITPVTTLSVNINSSATGTVCSGTPITFTAIPNLGGANTTYQWHVNGINKGTNSSIFTTSTLANGDIVTCTFTNNSAVCLTLPTVNSGQVMVSIALPAFPVPRVTIITSVNDVYAGLPITFTATTFNAGAAFRYQWQVNGINAGANSATFTTTTLLNGDKVTCTILSGVCLTPALSNVITAIIIPPLTITPPNTFTPNGDGINDLWLIPSMASYPNSLIYVYNRNGSVVFQSKGYSKAWDGNYNGNTLPTGTYYYVIDLGSNKPKVSGYIAIIR